MHKYLINSVREKKNCLDAVFYTMATYKNSLRKSERHRFIELIGMFSDLTLNPSSIYPLLFDLYNEIDETLTE